MSAPWIKFYPRDWRGDQALRVVSLAARGLWMEMLCIMHEASPRGHLLIGASAVTDGALARSAGVRLEEVQALLVELRDAGVFDRSRNGVILSRRMIADEKRSKVGRETKLEGLGRNGKNPPPSRSPSRSPSTQKPEARGKLEATRASSLPEAKTDFSGPQEVREAFVSALGEPWCRSYLDRCAWQDVPEKALTPATCLAAGKLRGEGRAVLIALGLVVLERAA